MSRIYTLARSNGRRKRWLAQRGLQFSSKKTRLVHLRDGFDFLGFNVRHYKDCLARSGWKLLIKPSKQSVAAIKEKLRGVRF